MSIISFQLLFVSMLSPVIQQDEPFQEAHRQREYISPSGEFRLKAETAPGDFAFAAIYGPANCELTRNAETIWSYTLPHSLGPAAVFDDGTVVGVGTYGRKDARGMMDSYFYVVIIDPSGTWLLNEFTKQRKFPTPHATSLPNLDTMFVDYDKRRLWLDVNDPPMYHTKSFGMTHRVLRVYDVDTGRKLSEIGPSQLCAGSEDDKCKLRIFGARPVPGTDLMLVHAVAYKENQPNDGVFAVVDSAGSTIWRREFAGDYASSGISEFRLRKAPVFGPGDTPGTFWIRSVHDDAKTKLEAIKNPATSAWAVQKPGQ